MIIENETFPNVAEIAPRRRQQKRSSDKVSAILQQALIEFAEHGFNSASTRRIAEKVGIGHQLLLYHFGTKDNLWREVILDVARLYRGWYSSELTGCEMLPAHEKLRKVQAGFIRFSAANPQLHSILTHRTGHSDERLEWMVEMLLKPILSIIIPLIESSQATGHYVRGNPVHVQYAFMGAVTRVFQLAPEIKELTGQSSIDEDFLERHIDLCLRLFFREPGEVCSQ